MTKSDGGAAFPQSMERYGGLTIRDWFAGQAMIGILMAEGPWRFGQMADHAKHAYRAADALLTARDAQ